MVVSTSHIIPIDRAKSFAVPSGTIPTQTPRGGLGVAIPLMPFVQCAIAARCDNVIASSADRLPRQSFFFACALSHTHLPGIEWAKLS